MFGKLKMAQDVLKDYSGGHGGFNSRIFGHTYQDRFGYPAYVDRAEVAGFYLADKMIMDGRLYYVQPFKHLAYGQICKGHPFPYGGTWVCNTCNNSGLDQPWWKVKVYKDGNAWCCIGPDFEDLQESNDYAFGDTRDEALANYEKLMLKPETEAAIP